MHYYIDGYNLLFRVVRAGDDLKSQRIKIINELQTKVRFLELSATLVFDAQYQHGEAAQTHFKGLDLLFTAEGETADEAILRLVKNSPKPDQCTVITSDKRLAWAARRRSAKTESIEEFLGWLNKRVKNKIRRLKEADKAPKALSLPKKPVKRDLTPPQTEEDRFQYYLKIFEEELKQTGFKIEDNLSELERWLKAFESPDRDE